MSKLSPLILLTISIVALIRADASWSRLGRADMPTPNRLARRVEPVFQKGISLAMWTTRGRMRGEADTLVGRQSVTAAKACGVEWIQVVPYGYQPSVNQPDIQYKNETSSLRTLINSVHGQGLNVMLKPHLWSREFYGTDAKWTGDIVMQSEDDWEIWFANYLGFILSYARLAEETRTEIFCIGLEYVRTTRERPEQWRALIRAIRDVYHGPLTYGAHFGDEMNHITFWDDLDYIGINAYPELTDKDRASVDELVAGWQPIIRTMDQLSARYRRPILLTEAGFNSIVGAGKRPWQWSSQQHSVVDLDEQAKCYESLFRAFWNKPWFAGVYFWKWYLNPDAGGATDPDYTPQNKPAQDVMRRWYTRAVTSDRGRK